MSLQRKACLESMKRSTECEVICVYKNDIASYILPHEPLHPAFEYLSETHKADYLRTYFMHFYGGGYSDIKMQGGSWKNAFDDLEESDAWINGYREIQGGVHSSLVEIVDKWHILVGNCAYICKPHTPLTQEWYEKMLKLLDTKLQLLERFPARFPQDCAEKSNYPIEWNEMLGRIFHRVCFSYYDHLLHTVPQVICYNYR